MMIIIIMLIESIFIYLVLLNMRLLEPYIIVDMIFPFLSCKYILPQLQAFAANDNISLSLHFLCFILLEIKRRKKEKNNSLILY